MQFEEHLREELKKSRELCLFWLLDIIEHTDDIEIIKMEAKYVNLIIEADI